MDNSLLARIRHRLILAAAVLTGTLLAGTGCQTTDPYALQRAAVQAQIQQEEPGNYFIGRRFYKRDYKMWGWVRPPRQPWNKAQLVMLNEQRVLAPDRKQRKLGSDNNFEYKLQGYFSGDQVYEPASNRFYPEFVLTGYEVLSTSPPMIFRDSRSIDPAIRILAPPM
jgi:hypothetical protein